MLAESCSILFGDARKLPSAKSLCPKRFEKFELHIWKEEVIKMPVKLSEGNWVTSNDVTIQFLFVLRFLVGISPTNDDLIAGEQMWLG